MLGGHSAISERYTPLETQCIYVTKRNKIYLIVTLTHLTAVVVWLAVLQQPVANSGSTFLETIFVAQLGFWFFSIGLQLNLDYHERKRNNSMVLFSWAVIFIGTFGFGILGLKELIASIIEFSDPSAITATIPIFWAYGIAQAGILAFTGDNMSSELTKRKRRRK
ncbi:MAG: hypothetical protein ABJG41_01155 [Cyclobacteriaceae bacterium]